MEKITHISTFKIKYPASEFEIRNKHELFHKKSNTFVAGSHTSLGMVEYIIEGDYIVAYCQTRHVSFVKEINISPLIKIEFLPFEV